MPAKAGHHTLLSSFIIPAHPCSAGFPDLDESVSLLSDLMVGEQFFRISA